MKHASVTGASAIKSTTTEVADPDATTTEVADPDATETSSLAAILARTRRLREGDAVTADIPARGRWNS